jgi:hypothetical protein
MDGEASEADRGSGRHRLGLALGRVVFGLGRRVLAALPGGAVRALEDRLFYSVFQVTRVTNDAYGWKPEAPGGGAPPPGVQPTTGARDGG